MHIKHTDCVIGGPTLYNTSGNIAQCAIFNGTHKAIAINVMIVHYLFSSNAYIIPWPVFVRVCRLIMTSAASCNVSILNEPHDFYVLFDFKGNVSDE